MRGFTDPFWLNKGPMISANIVEEEQERHKVITRRMFKQIRAECKAGRRRSLSLLRRSYGGRRHIPNIPGVSPLGYQRKKEL
jgi:hypothetical protein